MSKKIVFVSLLCLVGCASELPRTSRCHNPQPCCMDSTVTVNAYHNIHYQNPGFYPSGIYRNGNYHYARGYRY